MKASLRYLDKSYVINFQKIVRSKIYVILIVWQILMQFWIKEKYSKCRTNCFQTTAVLKIFWNNFQSLTDKSGLENSNLLKAKSKHFIKNRSFSKWKHDLELSKIEWPMHNSKNYLSSNSPFRKSQIIRATCVHAFILYFFLLSSTHS